jgi:hypothetical protein
MKVLETIAIGQVYVQFHCIIEEWGRKHKHAFKENVLWGVFM